MARATLLGGLPIILSGSNRGRLDRKAAAELLGISIEEVYQAYNLWIQLFRTKGCELTLLQYFEKLKDAGISVRALGNKPEDYHLARYGDVGPYTVTSCRFITKAENLREQKKSSVYSHMLTKYGPKKTKAILRKAGRLGGLKNRGKTRK